MVAHVHQDELDRYYTMPTIVDSCLATVDLTGFIVVEPSAGAGAFSDKMLECIAIDLSPAAEGIAQQDFLTFIPPKGKIAVVGNPPYGINGSLLVKFIKKACSFADLVAFVLPLSYAKESMHCRWPKNFHLKEQLILPTPNATLNGKPTATRNVWQVWEKRDSKRETIPVPEPVGWAKTNRENASVAMRTHGCGLGRLSDPSTANATSHLFIRFLNPLGAKKANEIGDYLASWPWPDLNMGQPSIGARDYVPVLNTFLAKE